MKRAAVIAAILLAFALAWRAGVGRTSASAPDPSDPAARTDLPAEAPVVADPSDPAAAVRQVHATIGAFLVAVKEPYRPPLGDNRDLVRALTGGNRYGDVFLASNHPALNAQGEWTDPWGRPYHIHARAADALDVRSAGPDGVLFNADDLTAP
ncbi:MAG TPA: hypothetical protein PKC67_10260 [Kiritimatiellia bacterium]|nr:hypothetical protein [Kiritimatiellia bacterium]HMP34721.1 hypothetical protein [Kiritimatiellia bacterium]